VIKNKGVIQALLGMRAFSPAADSSGPFSPPQLAFAGDLPLPKKALKKLVTVTSLFLFINPY
jgi:hypothetical protein